MGKRMDLVHRRRIALTAHGTNPITICIFCRRLVAHYPSTLDHQRKSRKSVETENSQNTPPDGLDRSVLLDLLRHRHSSLSPTGSGRDGNDLPGMIDTERTLSNAVG